MSELELELRDLGAALAFPETPPLATRVRARLVADAPRRRFRLDRRAVAIAVAVFAVAIAGVLAVPPARTAILEWLGIRGVELEFVDELPDVAVTPELDLGERTTLEQARRRASFRVRGPGGLGDPSLVYFREPPAGGQVAFLYGTCGRVRLLVTQFVGDYEPFVHKFVDGGATVEQVEVDGARGIWIDGLHFVAYEDEAGRVREEPVRLADNVLLWRKDGVTFRLEAQVTKERAVEIAESLA